MLLTNLKYSVSGFLSSKLFCMGSPWAETNKIPNKLMIMCGNNFGNITIVTAIVQCVAG
jgi:hypothetical protein